MVFYYSLLLSLPQKIFYFSRKKKVKESNNTMSFAEKVLGVDFGTQNTQVALISAHQRMPAIVRNNFSLESTPTVVAFDSDNMRFVGEEGLSKVTSRPQWAANLLRLHLRGVSDDDTNILYSLTDGALTTPNGSFTMVHLYAMLFNTIIKYARKLSATEDGDAPGETAPLPKRIVVSVPFCTSRSDMVVDALQILGMKKDDILVTTDGEAAVACYRGLRFNELPKAITPEGGAEGEEPAAPICIVDIGHGFHTVTIARIAKTNFEVLGQHSEAIGSASIDLQMLEKVLDTAQSVHKEDFRTQMKPLARLVKESMKAKEMLSTITIHTMQIEALTDTVDLQYKAAAEDILKYAEPLKAALSSSITTALSAANLAVSDISEVQVIGGGWRTPSIASHLKKELNVETLHVQLDPVQTVAQGCALMGMWLPSSQRPTEKTEEEREKMSEEEKKLDETNGVHFVDVAARENAAGDAEKALNAEELVALTERERALQEQEALINARLDAKNAFEAYILSLPNMAYEAQLSEAETTAIEAKVTQMDDWLYSEDCDTADTARFAEKLAEAKEDVVKNYPKIAEHMEKMKIEEEAKEKLRAEEAKAAKENKEPKSDPQRLKAALERKEQGVVLFKQESYADAVTRFVQALVHLKVSSLF